MFSSIQSADIDLTRALSRGAEAFKSFLKYAETGLLETGSFTGRDHDSEFECQVAKALAQHGYETHPQVGVAGFFIDLAVVDPEKPGRYLLGIECDGANYHRSRSARDRDRIRQAVLEDRGWVIHRIWSTDWFHRPKEELRKTLAAIETAKIEWASRTDGAKHQPGGSTVEQIEITRRDCDGNACESNGCLPTQPYAVASFHIRTSQEIHEVSTSELARVVSKIIEVEGPVHGEEITRRVTQLWGLQRTGSRICKAVYRALKVAAGAPAVSRDGDFYSLGNLTEVPVRDRRDVAYTTLRKAEMIPPVEIRKAVSALVQVHHGVAEDEAVTAAARLFGFKSTSPQLRRVIEREIRLMQKDHTLDERNGKLYVPERVT